MSIQQTRKEWRVRLKGTDFSGEQVRTVKRSMEQNINLQLVDEIRARLNRFGTPKHILRKWSDVEFACEKHILVKKNKQTWLVYEWSKHMQRDLLGSKYEWFEIGAMFDKSGVRAHVRQKPLVTEKHIFSKCKGERFYKKSGGGCGSVLPYTVKLRGGATRREDAERDRKITWGIIIR